MASRQREPRPRRRRGVSKAEWLDAGLEALRESSVAEITIGHLAKRLGIAKAGFYWHFENREELLRQMLEHWTHELTEVITGNVELRKLDPKNRLIATAEMVVDYDLGGLDMAIRQWALQDAKAARAVRRVNRLRLDFIRGAFEELGFQGDEAEMRAMLFVGYHSAESAFFREVPRKRRRALIESRVEMLARR